MLLPLVVALVHRSRPVWGAWIEIESYVAAESLAKGRAPYGARGLKSTADPLLVSAA